MRVFYLSLMGFFFTMKLCESTSLEVAECLTAVFLNFFFPFLPFVCIRRNFVKFGRPMYVSVLYTGVKISAIIVYFYLAARFLTVTMLTCETIIDA